MAYQRELITPVYMTEEAHAKQAALVERCNEEVAWFGVVEETEEGFPLVVDILVPRQVVTGGSVDGGTDEGAEYSLAAFLAENAAVVHKLRYTGHSHVHFACNPSVTDLNQIETWAEYGMPYMISHIQNKRGDTYTRIDCFEGIPISAEAEVEVLHDGDNPIIAWADDVLAEKVEKKVYKYTNTHHTHGDYSGYGMGSALGLGMSSDIDTDEDAKRDAEDEEKKAKNFADMYEEMDNEGLLGGGLS